MKFKTMENVYLFHLFNGPEFIIIIITNTSNNYIYSKNNTLKEGVFKILTMKFSELIEK